MSVGELAGSQAPVSGQRGEASNATLLDAIAETARSYIGTPYQHTGRRPGTSLDCLGVVVCAAKENGYQVEDRTDYRARGDADKLVRGLDANFDRTDLAQPGVIVRIPMGSERAHVGVLSRGPFGLELIHVFHSSRVAPDAWGNWKDRVLGMWVPRGVN